MRTFRSSVLSSMSVRKGTEVKWNQMMNTERMGNTPLYHQYLLCEYRHLQHAVQSLCKLWVSSWEYFFKRDPDIAGGQIQVYPIWPKSTRLWLWMTNLEVASQAYQTHNEDNPQDKWLRICLPEQSTWAIFLTDENSVLKERLTIFALLTLDMFCAQMIKLVINLIVM